MPLLGSPRVGFKPFEFPWAHHFWERQQKIHWLASEVPIDQDIKDWKSLLSDNERNLLTHIFRFFTEADTEVANCYAQHYSRIFTGAPEIQMMLRAFSNMESIHQNAYSVIVDTLSFPETEYSVFMNYKAMKDKHDYMRTFSANSKHEIAKTLAAFGAFTEGVQLFSSFAILLNFPRHGKMKNMGQIITLSVQDESLHVEGITTLFKAFIQENPEVWTNQLKSEILEIGITMVDHEDAFIDLAFEQGPIEGLTPEEMKLYIRFITDRRLLQLGLPTYFGVKDNPLPWLSLMLNSEQLVNQFEERPVSYKKASLTGTWEEAFSIFEDTESWLA